MNQNIILVIAIVTIIAMSMGTLVVTLIDANDNNDTETQVAANTKTLIESKDENLQIWEQFAENTEGNFNIHSKMTGVLTVQSEQIETMKGEIIELQAAIKTTNENFIALPETPPPKSTFHLSVTDVSQNIKSTFGINDIVYFTASADDSNYKTITYEIFPPSAMPITEDDVPLYKSDIGIPDRGAFTMIWTIPGTPESGIYTFTISDKGFSDSITFKVE